MTDFTSLVSLKSICAMALDEESKGIADMDKCWILGLRGYTQMTLDVTGQTETVRIPVLPNKTAPLPTNCLSWTKIGILDDKGQINTLRVNTALTTFRDNNPQRLQDLTPEINNSIGSVALVPYYSNYYYGGGVYQLFGVGGGVITYGECKVDEANRVIILGEQFQYPFIMVEFIVAPEKKDDYYVPLALREAIIMFIRWKLKLAKREEYYAELTIARRNMPKKKVVLQTLNQVLRESESFKLRS